MVAKRLCGEYIHKGNIWGSQLHNLMQTKKPNEKELNSTSCYKRSHGKGIPMCKLIRFIEKRDDEESRNMTGKNYLVYGTITLSRRSSKKEKQ